MKDGYRAYRPLALLAIFVYVVLDGAYAYLLPLPRGARDICDLMIFAMLYMIFSLGLRRIAVEATDAHPPRLRDYFWAFRGGRFVRHFAMGLCFSLMWMLPTLLRFEGVWPFAHRFVVFLLAEVCSARGALHPDEGLRAQCKGAMGAFRHAGRLVFGALKILLLYALILLAIVFLTTFAITGGSPQNLPEYDALIRRLVVMLCYTFACFAGPRYFHTETRCVLRAMDADE